LLTIAKADPLIISFPDMVRTYGDADFILTPPASNSKGAFNYTGSNNSVGKTGGSKITITGVGTASIIATQAPDSNYNAATISATLIVKKAPLVVKANHASRCIGKANPELTYSISGFVKGENASVLNSLPVARTDATDSSAAGTYFINVSGAEAANYSFTYMSGMLRVNKPAHLPMEMTTVDLVAGESAQLAARSFGVAYQWSPAIGLSAPNAAMASVSLNRDQEYTVSITENTGCVVVDKVKVRVFNNAGVYVPTAFTPNGDGNNDVLRVISPGIQSLQYFRVFNRWGQMIFETAEKGKGWDGRFKGVQQPQDTYVWLLMAAEKNGRELSQKGFVVLVR
jgi:gliding motility-associated-like protein